MTVQLELWHLLTTLGAFFGFFVAGLRALYTQIDRRLTERFAAQAAAQAEVKQAWERCMGDVAELARAFLRWQAEMPVQYVRREDHARSQTVVEAKLDAVALHIQNLHLREGGK